MKGTRLGAEGGHSGRMKMEPLELQPPRAVSPEEQGPSAHGPCSGLGHPWPPL